jgi:hypothetical protein
MRPPFHNDEVRKGLRAPAQAVAQIDVNAAGHTRAGTLTRNDPKARRGMD